MNSRKLTRTEMWLWSQPSPRLQQLWTNTARCGRVFGAMMSNAYAAWGLGCAVSVSREVFVRLLMPALLLHIIIAQRTSGQARAGAAIRRNRIAQQEAPLAWLSSVKWSDFASSLGSLALLALALISHTTSRSCGASCMCKMKTTAFCVTCSGSELKPPLGLHAECLAGHSREHKRLRAAEGCE